MAVNAKNLSACVSLSTYTKLSLQRCLLSCALQLSHAKRILFRVLEADLAAFMKTGCVMETMIAVITATKIQRYVSHFLSHKYS